MRIFSTSELAVAHVPRSLLFLVWVSTLSLVASQIAPSNEGQCSVSCVKFFYSLLILLSIDSHVPFPLLFLLIGLALTRFKEDIYEDPDHVLYNWNPLISDPCDWFGVSCTVARDHVIKL